MDTIFKILLLIMSMVCLLVEKSSCFEILVIGLLFGILFEIEKRSKDKDKKDEGR